MQVYVNGYLATFRVCPEAEVRETFRNLTGPEKVLLVALDREVSAGDDITCDPPDDEGTDQVWVKVRILGGLSGSMRIYRREPCGLRTDL